MNTQPLLNAMINCGEGNPRYTYEIRNFGAPHSSEGELIATFHSLTAAEKFWRREIAAVQDGPGCGAVSVAVLTHGIVVRDGKGHEWALGDAPNAALRT